MIARGMEFQKMSFPPHVAMLLLRHAAKMPAYRVAVRWRFPPSPAAAGGGMGTVGGGCVASDDFSAALGMMAELATGMRAMDDPVERVESSAFAAQCLLEMAEPLGVLPNADVTARVVQPVVARAACEAREAGNARQLPPGCGALDWALAQHKRLLSLPPGAGLTHVPVGLYTVRVLVHHFGKRAGASAGLNNVWVQAFKNEIMRDEYADCKFVP